MKPPLPPSYVNTPVPIAYAQVDDALIVTMTLSWPKNTIRSGISRAARITLLGYPP